MGKGFMVQGCRANPTGRALSLYRHFDRGKGLSDNSQETLRFVSKVIHRFIHTLLIRLCITYPQFPRLIHKAGR
jgi:hypothetical protein